MSELLSAVPSPCISICKLDEDRVYCTGCLRTRDEIREWSRVDDARRQEIVDIARARRARAVAADPSGRAEFS